VCRAFGTSGYDIAPCATIGLEHLSARDSGDFIQPQSGSVSWLSVGAGATARWHWFDFLALGVWAGARLETARPRILLEGCGEARRLAPVAVTLRAGPAWIF
jgi:hypothetical protein